MASEDKGFVIMMCIVAALVGLLIYMSWYGTGYAGGGYIGGYRGHSMFYRNDAKTYQQPSNRAGSVYGVNRVSGGAGYGK